MKTWEMIALALACANARFALAQDPPGVSGIHPVPSIGVAFDLSVVSLTGISTDLLGNEAWAPVDGTPLGLYAASGQAPRATVFAMLPLGGHWVLSAGIGYGKYHMTAMLTGTRESYAAQAGYDVIIAHPNEQSKSTIDAEMASAEVTIGWQLPLDRAIVTAGIDVAAPRGVRGSRTDEELDSVTQQVVRSTTLAWQPSMNRAAVGITFGLLVPAGRIGPMIVTPNIALSLPITNLIESAHVGEMRFSMGIALRFPLGSEPGDPDDLPDSDGM